MNYGIIFKMKSKAPIAYYAIKSAIESHNVCPDFQSKLRNINYIDGILTGLYAVEVITIQECNLLGVYFSAYLK